MPYADRMSADFPSAAPVGAAELLHAAAGAVGAAQARIAVAAAGLFVPDDHQLDDYQRTGMRLLLDRLTGELKRSLPNFMQPAEIRLLEAIPRTPNGKHDRVALAAMVAREAE